MKVKLKDIKPNPYRYINKGYPINKDKVEHLRQSIKRTGFWDNLVARENDGNIEIAYGHHRIEALRKDFDPNHEIGLIIRPISDADMLRIMAAENDSMDIMSPAVINETVRAAKDFLEKHPEELKKLCTGTQSWERKGISLFLNWSENRVADALGAIHDIEKGVIEKKEYESIPFQRSAEDFRQAVKTHNLPQKIRNKIIDDLKNGVEQPDGTRKSVGHRHVAHVVMQYKLSTGKRSKSDVDKEITINDVASVIIEAILKASVTMNDAFVSNWAYVSKENRGKILYGAKTLFAKFERLNKKEQKLIGGK